MKNVGNVDRVIRVIIGLGLLVVLVFVKSPVRFVGLLGFVMLFTAFVRVCPLYMPFKINTNLKKSEK